jgi:hypothetical protein
MQKIIKHFFNELLFTFFKTQLNQSEGENSKKSYKFLDKKKTKIISAQSRKQK